MRPPSEPPSPRSPEKRPQETLEQIQQHVGRFEENGILPLQEALFQAGLFTTAFTALNEGERTENEQPRLRSSVEGTARDLIELYGCWFEGGREQHLLTRLIPPGSEPFGLYNSFSPQCVLQLARVDPQPSGTLLADFSLRTFHPGVLVSERDYPACQELVSRPDVQGVLGQRVATMDVSRSFTAYVNAYLASQQPEQAREILKRTWMGAPDEERRRSVIQAWTQMPMLPDTRQRREMVKEIDASLKRTTRIPIRRATFLMYRCLLGEDAAFMDAFDAIRVAEQPDRTRTMQLRRLVKGLVRRDRVEQAQEILKRIDEDAACTLPVRASVRQGMLEAVMEADVTQVESHVRDQLVPWLEAQADVFESGRGSTSVMELLAITVRLLRRIEGEEVLRDALVRWNARVIRLLERAEANPSANIDGQAVIVAWTDVLFETHDIKQILQFEHTCADGLIRQPRHTSLIQLMREGIVATWDLETRLEQLPLLEETRIILRKNPLISSAVARAELQDRDTIRQLLTST